MDQHQNKEIQDSEYKAKADANEALMASRQFILITQDKNGVAYCRGGKPDVCFAEYLGLIEYALNCIGEDKFNTLNDEDDNSGE